MQVKAASTGAIAMKIEKETAIAFNGERMAMTSQFTFASTATPTLTPDRVTTRQPYPKYKIIVLNDDFNTFGHVAKCLMKYIPNMTPDRAWDLTNQVHFEGQATVWVGPLEQAELYHQQLSREGLTMAPLEKA